jgi:hypothetical protein
MPPWTSRVASGMTWAYLLGRLLKNPFQQLNKCIAQNTWCGLGGSLAHYGPLSIRYGQGQRGAQVGLHPEAPWGSCHRRHGRGRLSPGGTRGLSHIYTNCKAVWSAISSIANDTTIITRGYLRREHAVCLSGQRAKKGRYIGENPDNDP